MPASIESPPTPAAVPSPGGDTAVRKLAYRTFVAAVLAHVVADCFGQSIWPVYKKLAGLDLALAGYIATIVGMTSAGMQPLFGLWADRIGRRTFILLGTMLTTLALLLGPLTAYWPAVDRAMPGLFGLPASYMVILLILLAGRIGQDLFHPAGAGVAGTFSATRGTTFMAVFVAFGSIGYGLSQRAFSMTYKAFGGHTEILLLPAIGMMVLIWAWCRPPAADHGGKGEPLLKSLAALRPVAGHILVLFLILALSAGVLNGLYFLMPEFIAHRGYPDRLGDGDAFGLIVLGSTLMMIPMAHLADQIGRKRMLIIMMVLSAVSYHAIIRLPVMPVWGFSMLCVAGGAFMGTVNPLGVAFGQRLAPRNVSMVSSILMGLAWCLSNTVPGIVGYVAKHSSAENALTWLSLANVVMVALGFLLPSSKGSAPSSAKPQAGAAV